MMEAPSDSPHYELSRFTKETSLLVIRVACELMHHALRCWMLDEARRLEAQMPLNLKCSDAILHIFLRSGTYWFRALIHVWS
ncbi:hypothetical protein Plhal304r1_c015g0054901 [Plasmopara halstedii]